MRLNLADIWKLGDALVQLHNEEQGVLIELSHCELWHTIGNQSLVIIPVVLVRLSKHDVAGNLVLFLGFLNNLVADLAV